MVNSNKCFFGVLVGKLLGFVVSHRIIEVNQEKIIVILDITRPVCLKDVQRLASCVAAFSLSRHRLGDKGLPLRRILKNSDKFVWNNEADASLAELKHVLYTAPYS
jgi:hypothetical protein